MRLSEKYRPACWSDIVGQDKALAKINRLRANGLGGRAFLIVGHSGSGKTSIARLLCAEVDPTGWATEELDAERLTPARLAEIERRTASRPLGGGGHALIVDETHAMSAAAVRQWLVATDPIPEHVIWCLTTTRNGEESLFGNETGPFTSRCEVISLTRQGVTQPIAELLQRKAILEILDGQPLSAYVRLINDCKGNVRQAYAEIEGGRMLAKGGGV